MQGITRSCVLLLLVSALAFVRGQDCKIKDFLDGPLFDSNFNTTSLAASYPTWASVRVNCNAGFGGFFQLICVHGQWKSRGKKCEIQQCPAIIVDDNVEVTGDPLASPVGSVLKFSCKSSSEVLNGPDDLYCAETKEWSADPPTCGAPTTTTAHVSPTAPSAPDAPTDEQHQ